MFEATLKTDSISDKTLKQLFAVMPISLTIQNTISEKEKMKANFELLNSTIRKVTIVIRDFLQVDNLRCQYPEANEIELKLKAFEMGIEWLKNNAELILTLNIPFEIIAWYQIMYDNFSDFKIHDLFVKNSLPDTLLNIDNWANQFKATLTKNNNHFLENSLYIDYINKTEKLTEDSKLFKGAVNASYRRLLQKTENPTLEIQQNHKNYILKETAVYWMWGEQKQFNCTLYKSDINPAMQYIKTEFLNEAEFPHFIFKYHHIKKTTKQKNNLPSNGAFNLHTIPLFFNQNNDNLSNKINLSILSVIIQEIAKIQDEKTKMSFFQLLIKETLIKNESEKSNKTEENTGIIHTPYNFTANSNN